MIRLRPALFLALILGTGGALAAQDLRGWSQSNLRYLELRPLTVSGADPVVNGTTLASQDVGFTAWGFGVTGLSTTALLRARHDFGGDLSWPQYNDRLDVILGYAELRRSALRVRVGRQTALGGLGFSGFDGVDVHYERSGVWGQAYGGRSLARGLAETARDALRGIEDFIPDQDAWLVGAATGWADARTTLGLRYQREIWSDRSSLVSERAAFDMSTRIRAVRLRGNLDYDLHFGRVGKASLTAQHLFNDGQTMVEIEGRRYLPYFDLSTIWGFFSPVPYHEARLRVASGTRALSWRVEGGLRSYGDPSTITVLEPLEDRAWQMGLGAEWVPASDLRIALGWDLDWGTSAFLHSLDLRLGWTPSDRLALGLNGTSFQQFEGFRVGDGRAVGMGADLRAGLTDQVAFDAGLFVMRHDAGRGEASDFWTQTRAWTGLRYTFGDDPALGRRR